MELLLGISRVFTDIKNVSYAIKSGNFEYIKGNPFKHREYKEKRIATALYKKLVKKARISKKLISLKAHAID